MIRIVQNKNGSLTAYVPAKYASRFPDILEAGKTDLYESCLSDDEMDIWSDFGYTWEVRK